AEKGAGMFNPINAGWFDLDFFEPGCLEFRSIFIFRERAGDTADPQKHALANFGRHGTASDNIGNGKTPAGFQYAECLAQYAIFVRGEIDDAVRDDDIDGVVGKRNVLDLTLEEFHIVYTGLFLIFT